MDQISSETFNCLSRQRLLNNQGVGGRATSVRNKTIKRWAVWLVLFTLLALFYVWSRVQVIQLGYEITTLESKIGELSKGTSSLEMEIAKLKSPKRLEEVATQKLGMHPPSGDQIVLVKP